MQCNNQSAHAGHYWQAEVWNDDLQKYETKSVWCPGKVV